MPANRSCVLLMLLLLIGRALGLLLLGGLELSLCQSLLISQLCHLGDLLVHLHLPLVTVDLLFLQKLVRFQSA